MQIIKRQDYLDFLIRSKDRQIIKVVSGVRRCGKSTLFEIYRAWLIDQGIDPQQIISINFEDIDYEDYTHYKKLYDYIKSRLLPDKMNYIFLDEIQHVAAFEKTVDSLFIRKNVDLYLTGSNAYFMSGDLATLLSGRYIELKMLPLSFKEYSEWYQATGNARKSKGELYTQYLENSAFPYTLQIQNRPKDIREYLDGIYSSILLKDVVSRLKIADVMMLESVVKFVFNNIGNLLSTTKIANTMTSEGRKISGGTVERYLKGLMDSLLIYQARRYHIKGKQYLATLEKYYAVDIGLRYFLLGDKGRDTGHILENVVYLELIRRGYDVYVGHLQEGEIDFVAMGPEGLSYYQVALSTLEEKTLSRELAPFDRLKDAYPKNLLTLDEIEPNADYNGIRKQNALDWLLE